MAGLSRVIVELGPSARGLNRYILNSFRKLVKSGITNPLDLNVALGSKVAERAAAKGLITKFHVSPMVERVEDRASQEATKIPCSNQGHYLGSNVEKILYDSFLL